MHALRRHTMHVRWQTIWPSHIRPWPRTGNISHDQTWYRLMSYYHLRLFHVTTFSFIRTTLTHMPTSFWPHIPKNDLPTYIILSKHIPFLVLYLYNYTLLHFISLTLNSMYEIPPLPNTLQQTNSRTRAFLCERFNTTLRFNNHSCFAIYALYCKWTLLHQQASNHNTKNTTLTKISSFNSLYSVLYFYTHINK